MIRFAHFSDIHLGYRQYGLDERFEDFHLAWQDAIRLALEEQPEFVLIAGDLFQKRNTDPRAFEQAISGLLRFKERGIPVIAIEGNHDRLIHNREYSWVRVLARQGLLVLLDLVNEEGALELLPYDHSTQRGGYIDLPCGVRVMGIRYRGERLKRDLKMLAEGLEREGTGDARATILMAHTGVETSYHIAAPDHVLLSHLQPLRPWVNYVGVGHIHRKKVVDNWVFQPGSLECCSSTEAQTHLEHGIFVGALDPAKDYAPQMRLLAPARRPFLLLEVDVHGVADLTEVNRRLRQQLAQLPPPASPPVVHLTLVGEPLFPEGAVRDSLLEGTLEEALQPLTVQRISFRKEAAPTEDEPQENSKRALSRRALEREIFRDAYLQNVMDPSCSELMAEATVAIKALAEDSEAPSSFFQHLDEFQSAQEAAALLAPQESQPTVLETDAASKE